MSLQTDGVWKGAVWASTVWVQDVWFEGAYVPPAAQDSPSNWKNWGDDWRDKRRKDEEEEELARLERILDSQLTLDPIDFEIKQILSGELLEKAEAREPIFEQVDYDLYRGVFEDIYAEIQKSLMEKKRNNLRIALLLLLN